MFNMTDKEIFDYFHSKTDDFVELTAQLVNHRSYSKEKENINGLIDDIEHLFSRFLHQKKRISTKAGDILIMHFFPEKKDFIAFPAHVDTVRVSEDFTGSVRIDDKLFGNGTYDMKSAISIFHSMIEAIYGLNIGIETGIKIILTPDEETGSKHSLDHILKECQNASAALIAEPSCDDGSVKVRRKAIAHLNIIIRGIASHSGIAPHKGVDANKELIMVLNRIYSMLEDHPGIDFNPGIIAGGVKKNVVSPDSFLDGELRSFDNDSLIDFMGKLVRFEKNDMPMVKIDAHLSRPALEFTENNEKLYKKAKNIAEKLGYDLGACSTGGASDGSNISFSGIPVLDGLGIKGGGAHTENEYIEIGDFPFRAALLLMMTIK